MRTEEYSLKEPQLIESLSNNSESAFRVIYEQHYQRIYGLAMRNLKCEVLAQEVVQEVFMKLWLNRKTTKFEGPVIAWLFTVGKNNIINKLKKIACEWKAMNQIRLNHTDEDDSLQENIKAAEYQQMLKGALGRLSEKQLQVYTLARQENLSYNQIAEHMDISPLTVKTHMSRALGSIKTTINATRLFN